MESDFTAASKVSELPSKRLKESSSHAEAVFCWGAHDYGQLGLGAADDTQVATPRQLLTLPVNAFTR